MRYLILLGGFLLVTPFLLGKPAAAQAPDFDPAWYTSDQPYLKLAVVEDGVYVVDGAQLQAAGAPLAAIDPHTLRLFENGQEIPIWSTGDGTASLQAAHRIAFVGRRNRGTDEAWVYQNNPSLQSSTFYSLYTDTTFYWLTWGDAPGLRYDVEAATPHQPEFTEVDRVRETVHREVDRTYFYGDSFDAGHPLYTRGEGFYWTPFSHTNTDPVTETFHIALPEASPGAEMVHVGVRFSSESASRHRITVEAQILDSGNLVFQPFGEADWNGYAFQEITFSFPQDQVPTNGVLSLRITSHNDFNGTPNRSFLDWIEASYVRSLTTSAAQFSFDLPEAGSYNLTANGYAGTTAHVFVPALQRILEAPVVGGQIQFSEVLPQPTTFWAVQQEQFLLPAAVVADAPSNLAATSNAADYLIVTAPGLHASAQAMAAYREASGYTVQVVDVSDVFDQFDYGRPTPLAIRRFLRWTRQWSTTPQFLLLWGDAPSPTEKDRSLDGWAVPSFGYAPSDGWFAMQVNGLDDWSEFMAIGRITARTNEEGLLFLQKLQSYEATPLQPWQKRLLLLAGGGSPSEQGILQAHTLRWGDVAATVPAGMDTLRFFKQAFLPLDPSFQDSLRAAFRQGAGWLNYFGHSAAHTWEIVTDTPDEFDNAARLPMVVSLGCRTGSFAGGQFEVASLPSFGEQLVVGSLNGAIAHWGSSDQGVISASARLNDPLVDLVFRDTLRVVGVAIQKAKEEIAHTYNDFLTIKHLLQFNLIGDPATQLALPTAPDFHLDASDISIDPVAPVPADSQMSVSVRLNNQGLIASDSVTVVLRHTTPGGRLVSYTRRLPPFALRQALVFVLPLSTEMVGRNVLEVQADPDNAFAEVDEFNNSVALEQVVFATGLTLVAPQHLGLVTEARPVFRMSLASAEAFSTPLLIELDSVPSFDSPTLVRASLEAGQLAAKWQPPHPLESERTYYWRARIDDPTEPANWQEAAFTVRTDLASPGWLQKGPLFAENVQDPFLAFRPDEPAHWAFTDYRVEVFFSSERGRGSFKGGIVINGAQYLWNTFGFGFLVVDGNTGEVRENMALPTYVLRPNLADRESSIDSTTAVAKLDEITRDLRVGDYVFVRTRHLGGQNNPDAIQEEVKAMLRRLGSTAIDTLTYRHLWLLSMRVGHPETLQEWVAPPQENQINEITQELILNFSYPAGQTTSPRIGPARAWNTLAWEAAVASADSEVRVEVLSMDGQTVLLDAGSGGNIDLASLDARTHPYLRLRAVLSDSSQASTPQLRQWHVIFEAIPELALDPAAFTLAADTLAEGEPLTLTVGAHNLSTITADEALIEYFITDAQNRTQRVGADTLMSLRSDASRILTRSFPTDGLRGKNGLKIVLSQPGLSEPITFNNVLFRSFYIRADQTPPSFQVFVEGRQYPNDPLPPANVQDPTFPFVSARPLIEIDVEDNSDYLLLTDTTGLALHLDGQRVPFTHPDLSFEPATAQRNRARLVFMPDLAGRDTTHTLSVEIADAAGNEAEPYQVHFRVQSSVQVESLYPYPNPMSSVTTFAFQLRGADPTLIEDLRLRIFTINGSLVRQFDLLRDPGLLDGGALRIGWNKLLWDTRDEDGDLVGSGVYLYKVYLRAENETLEVNNGASVEKLVVIR